MRIILINQSTFNFDKIGVCVFESNLDVCSQLRGNLPGLLTLNLPTLVAYLAGHQNNID